jgi:hypothetical protein
MGQISVEITASPGSILSGNQQGALNEKFEEVQFASIEGIEEA